MQEVREREEAATAASSQGTTWDRAKSLGRRGRARVATVLVTVAFVIAGGTVAANASTTDTDLTVGSGDTYFSSIENYFKDHVIASVLVLVALMTGVGLLIRWGRKAAHSS